MKSRKKMLAALAAAMGLAVLAPAANASVTGSVTGDDGNPAALPANGAPAGIRNMDVKAYAHVDKADGGSWAAVVTDPSGASEATMDCAGTSYWNDDDRYVDYHGNGTYKLTVTV